MSPLNGMINEPMIFIISEYVDPKINSTGYYWSKIINGVSTAFPNVAVICPGYGKLENYPFEANRVGIFPITQSSYKKNQLLLRLFGLLNLSYKFIVKILKNVRKNDLIFSGTNPIFLLLCIALAKKTIRFKWVLLVHDVFPDNLAAAGILEKSYLFYRILDALFRWAYQSADALIVIGRDMEELFKAKQVSGQLIYQPNWVNKGEIDPINRSQSALIRDLTLESKIVFQFFGNAGRLQGIDNLLNAVELVTSPKAAFLFIGEGSEFSVIQDFAIAHPRLPISLISNADLRSRNEGLAACDIALVSLRTGMQGIGVPSKTYFSLAADRPILGIVDPNSEIAQMINENDGVGWHCDPGNPEKLAALIDEICALDSPLSTGKARALMESQYDEAPAIKKYIDTIKSIIGADRQ